MTILDQIEYFGQLWWIWTTLVWKPFQQKTLPEAQRTQGIVSITWGNLSTRIVWNWFQWNFMNWLQTWPPDGATCIDYQFCHRMHQLYIDSKFDHQMASLALLTNLQTRLLSPVLPDCLGLPYWHTQLVLTWHLHQPESHQLSLQQPLIVG